MDAELYWLEVTIMAFEEVAEQLASDLRPYAEGESVVLEQLGNPQDLDPNALLPEVYVKLYIAAVDDTVARREAVTELAQAYQCPPPTFTKLQEIDWAHAWKEHYKPFRLGQRFWIQPSWLAAEDKRPDDITITLDPGMAFGTGLHPTTQMCFELLTERLQPDQSVLDIGTGSGILAIAAAKLGANPISAIDNDETAVEAAAANAILNGVGEQIEIVSGTLGIVKAQEWDIVVVNILATVIMPMLTDEQLLSFARPQGLFIFSGIVSTQADEFINTVITMGGEIVEQTTQEDWVAFVVRRK